MYQQNNNKGFLQTCIDRRFVASSRKVFEKETGLSPTDYWHESYAGGAALNLTNTVAEDFAFSHGARIFGWQAHGDNCGGKPEKE